MGECLYADDGNARDALMRRLMYEIEELIGRINPRQTVLLLGAGASIPSGGPSGAQLAVKLARRIPGFGADSAEYSLAEICSFFEQKLGRTDLATAVRKDLNDLQPTGGLQLLPVFDWYRIYGTNFDKLVETVYARAERDLVVRRSNFDFSRDAPNGVLEYYKIHGCISEDVGFGDQSRMLLTEEDYEEPTNFREVSFRALSADMLTKDIVVVGQSLADPHLRDLVRETLKLRNQAGAPGRIFILAFEADEHRAAALGSRGADVYFGDLDHFLNGLISALPEEEVRGPEDVGEFAPSMLPSELVSVTTSVGHAMTLQPHVRQLFNGSPATYADIVNNLTFKRSIHADIVNGLAERPIAVLLGAGGVGKTTLARKIVVEIGGACDAAWEHNNAFPFQAAYWVEYEQRLRAIGQTAVLLIDDCTDVLSQVGQLSDHLGRTTDPALKLVLTATTGKWQQRSKSRYFFSHGLAYQLSRLTRPDLNALLELTAATPQIRELVEERFLSLPRGEQLRVLQDRCSADMYVCMKNIFASEDLDFILLREFGELNEVARDLYRHVAALEALGARVHRQLIMRMLGIEAGSLAGILQELTGVVSEFDVSVRHGLYGWETRHKIIATVIARYKYAQQPELDSLFERFIDAINPSVRLEVESLKALCTEEFGIDRLSNPQRQVDLLARVVRLLPGESIPRHRLIRHLIDQDRLDESTRALIEARDAIRPNPVLARYEVLILLRRADLTQGLMDEDRIAVLLDAEGRAKQNLHRYPSDMHTYRMYGDVATALAQRGAGMEFLTAAVASMREAEQSILDPAFAEMRRRLETELRQVQLS